MLAALGLPVALVRKMSEVGMALGSANDDAAAMTPVAAVGTTARRIFLAPKAEAAVTARPPLHKNGHAVDEHEVIWSNRFK